MKNYYEVYGKIATTEKVEAISGEFPTKEKAFAHMMEAMGRYCDLGPELMLIARNGAPSPRYRKSVYKNLSKFFYQGKPIRVETIDYSDFSGEVRSFPPAREEFATGYEERMGIVEYYGYARQDITEYDRKLGFIFSAGAIGFHVQFVDPKVRSSCMFQLCGEEYAFNYESGTMGHASVDIRVVKREGSIPARIESATYPALLLEILLNEREMRPIVADVSKDGDPNACLLWRFNHELYEKMNSAQCTALSEIEVSSDRIKGYMDAIEKVGYGVITKMKKSYEINFSGKRPIPVNKVERKYYIPPLICRADAELILRSIRESDLLDKDKLAEKFMNESGYYRYAEDPEEEAQISLPHKSDEGWMPSCYSLMILKILRLMDHAVPATSGTGVSLQSLITQHYGKEIYRVTINEHLSSMIAAGLPIEKVTGGYVIDSKRVLTRGNLSTITDLIAQDKKLCNATKERLIRKIEEKFPII